MPLPENPAKAYHDHEHNLDVDRIKEIAIAISNHCLSGVAKQRTLLLLEGALNISIFDYLL